MERPIDFRGEVLILTGPPGSGKTTAAARLSHAPGSPKVHLPGDEFWRWIGNGSIPPYLAESHRQNEVVMGVLAKAAEGYALGGYFVILDGIVGPWFLSPFTSLRVPVHYVVLRPALEEAVQRCRDRGGGELSDPAPISDLYRQFACLGELEAHGIRTEGMGPDEVLLRVKEALANGAFRLGSRHGAFDASG
ncbi:MAG TPA: AAA family ATPase [Fimbriimonas sp.]